jgi:hypothetical protein
MMLFLGRVRWLLLFAGTLWRWRGRRRRRRFPGCAGCIHGIARLSCCSAGCCRCSSRALSWASAALSRSTAPSTTRTSGATSGCGSCWPLPPFNGTPFKPWIWRLLGVKVGKRLVRCRRQHPGEDTGVHRRRLRLQRRKSAIQCHSLEDGTFKSGHVVLGDRCFLGVGAFVHYGVPRCGTDRSVTGSRRVAHERGGRPGGRRASWATRPATCPGRE